MASGRKTGGRIKGTPNKKTGELAERLVALGCDPIEGMAQLALDKGNPPEMRGRMFAELAGYLYPKRKAVEVKSDDGPCVIFQISTEPPPTVEV
jgi:hypothetical protein